MRRTRRYSRRKELAIPLVLVASLIVAESGAVASETTEVLGERDVRGSPSLALEVAWLDMFHHDQKPDPHHGVSAVLRVGTLEGRWWSWSLLVVGAGIDTDALYGMVTTEPGFVLRFGRSVLGAGISLGVGGAASGFLWPDRQYGPLLVSPVLRFSHGVGDWFTAGINARLFVGSGADAGVFAASVGLEFGFDVTGPVQFTDTVTESELTRPKSSVTVSR